YVSGRHAELSCDATGCYIVDLGSTNGTVVNGKKLTANERQLLLDGDDVMIGQTTYRFETAGPPEEAPAPAAARQEPRPPSEEQPPPPPMLGELPPAAAIGVEDAVSPETAVEEHGREHGE